MCLRKAVNFVFTVAVIAVAELLYPEQEGSDPGAFCLEEYDSPWGDDDILKG